MIFREMAKEHGMTLVEFSEHAAKNSRVDFELDQKMREIGLKGNVVLDGQLCWYFLKKEADWKVMLTCEENARISRIHDRDRETKGESVTLESARHETVERERIEQHRYKEIYGVDLSNESYIAGNHDIIIDAIIFQMKAGTKK
jgi:cytidylate kinase